MSIISCLIMCCNNSVICQNANSNKNHTTISPLGGGTFVVLLILLEGAAGVVVFSLPEMFFKFSFFPDFLKNFSNDTYNS